MPEEKRSHARSAALDLLAGIARLHPDDGYLASGVVLLQSDTQAPLTGPDLASLEEVLKRKQEMNDARKAHVEAKNHVVLESIFLTKPVQELALLVLTSLWEAWVSVSVGERDPRAAAKYHEGFNAATARATSQLAQLEDLMRADLLPASVEAARKA